jgi:hypothetical protein
LLSKPYLRFEDHLRVGARDAVGEHVHDHALSAARQSHAFG